MCLVKTKGAIADFSTLVPKCWLLPRLIIGYCICIQAPTHHCQKAYFLCLLAKEEDNGDMLSDNILSFEFSFIGSSAYIVKRTKY